jgi:alkaline phosphatase D
VNFQVLDTRQYRTDQPNGDRSSPLNEEARRATNSLLGSRQGGWLKSNLLQSTSQWNVLAQQVMMGVANISRTDQPAYSMDQWPGALAERESLMEFIANRRVPNPVVLTGDIHSNWVNDLHVDDTKPEAPVVATEFVGTSISSGGNGSAVVPNLDKFMSRNPGVRYFNTQRGYVLCTVQPESWRSDYRIVEKVTEKEAPVTTGASFIVESDRPGAKKV